MSVKARNLPEPNAPTDLQLMVIVRNRAILAKAHKALRR